MDNVFMLLIFIILFGIIMAVSAAIVFMSSVLVEAANNIWRQQK